MEAFTWTILIILILTGIVAGVLISFYLLQEKMIFAPIQLPPDYVFPFKNVSERYFQVEDGVRLHGLLFKSKGESRGLVFYIHGNADNLRYWGEFAPFFTKRNYDILMYDFRGFGKSEGIIRGERNMQRDAKIIYQQMMKEYTEPRIIVYGFSLGTGIAARLASNNQPKALILEAPYYNFIDLIKYHKSYLPASWITKYYFRTNRYLPKVKCPIYIFHGKNDRKVPFYSGERLKSTNPNIQFYKVDEATHNDMQDMKVFQREMDKILG